MVKELTGVLDLGRHPKWTGTGTEAAAGMCAPSLRSVPVVTRVSAC